MTLVSFCLHQPVDYACIIRAIPCNVSHPLPPPPRHHPAVYDRWNSPERMHDFCHTVLVIIIVYLLSYLEFVIYLFASQRNNKDLKLKEKKQCQVGLKETMLIRPPQLHFLLKKLICGRFNFVQCWIVLVHQKVLKVWLNFDISNTLLGDCNKIRLYKYSIYNGKQSSPTPVDKTSMIKRIKYWKDG